jgi:hypothetical protein
MMMQNYWFLLGWIVLTAMVTDGLAALVFHVP